MGGSTTRICSVSTTASCECVGRGNCEGRGGIASAGVVVVVDGAGGINCLIFYVLVRFVGVACWAEVVVVGVGERLRY